MLWIIFIFFFISSIRGRLGSLWLFLRNIGILIAFILGATLEYEYIPFTGMILPIIFVFTFMMLPQTPQYLLKKGQFQVKFFHHRQKKTTENFIKFIFQKAEDALKFYRGYAGRSKEEENALYNEFEKLKTITNDRKTEHKIQATDFCKLFLWTILQISKKQQLMFNFFQTMFQLISQ